MQVQSGAALELRRDAQGAPVRLQATYTSSPLKNNLNKFCKLQ